MEFFDNLSSRLETRLVNSIEFNFVCIIQDKLDKNEYIVAYLTYRHKRSHVSVCQISESHGLSYQNHGVENSEIFETKRIN